MSVIQRGCTERFHSNVSMFWYALVDNIVSCILSFLGHLIVCFTMSSGIVLAYGLNSHLVHTAIQTVSVVGKAHFLLNKANRCLELTSFVQGEDAM